MAGFFVSNFISGVECPLKYPDKCVKRKMDLKSYTVMQYTSNKFLDDKIFESTEAGEVYIIEGCILNKKKLISEYGAGWIEALQNMKRRKEIYFTDFRGAFSGAHYSPSDDEWTFYTNHLGDHQIFYWNDGEKFIVTSDMNWMTDALKSAGIKYTLDMHAVKSLLTYGWVEGNGTIAVEVRKVLPGNFIRIEKGKLTQVQEYHRFVNTKFTHQSEDEIINEIDKRFRNAIALEYDKDNEYGYKHMALLSGGLDSRMGLWVAKNMGYAPITAFTFGQSNGEDIAIASQIAQKLGISHLIKTLDDAAYLQNIQDSVRRTFGLVEVSGTHGASELLNYDEIGLMHGGLIGDAVIGTHWKSHIKASGLIGGNTDLNLIPYNRNYENEELYFYYERVMHLTLGVQCSNYENTEYASPFTDIDFWEYCLTIPLKYRYNHYIYKKWILKCYPEAAEFDWEKTGAKITDSEIIVKLKNTHKNLKRRLNGFSELNKGMNPYDYWYESNIQIKEMLDGMFEDLLETDLLEESFKCLIRELYNTKGCRVKVLLISALQCVREYF